MRCLSRRWVPARLTTPRPRQSTPSRWSNPRVAAPSYGLRGPTGDQLRPDVCRPGFGVFDGLGGGVAGAFGAAGLGRGGVWGSNRGADEHSVAGSVVDDDGVGRRTVCGLDD